MYKVIDNYFDTEIISKCYDEWPHENDQLWSKRTDLFQKNQYMCNKIHLLPKGIKTIIDYFSSDKFVQYVRDISDIPDLETDPYYHGGGILQYGRGGYLDKHLDYDIHPKTGMQRRINVILYVEKWREEWNGALQLYHGDQLLDKIYPFYNRLLIFEINDHSWHGFPEELKCPEGVFRKTVNVYYVSKPTPEKQLTGMMRPRAYFVPTIRQWTENDYKTRDEYCTVKNCYIQQYDDYDRKLLINCQ